MPETTHPLNFRKSSYSGSQGNCVEVADIPGTSAIRDTKRRTDGHLPFPTDEWAAFLTTLTR
ncbi:DUF397 domain-containing protein [Nocardiopsis alba]|uniref:DUF397 domain-containing protein n=1 Tax=Nocardiopsis alba TaxID=53437 RepID=UPI0005A9A0B6|nr:DUF397 domain-containing protein [Nocardiopsis alba]